MDNIFEIVVFVVTAVIFIISAITKQKKKPQGQTGSIDNLVESFFGIQNETINKQYEPFEDDTVFEETTKNIVINNNIKIAEEGIDAVPNKTYDEIETDDEPLPDFDIRQAIIYSEILNRKYF